MATDDVGVVSRSLTINGVPQTLDANGIVYIIGSGRTKDEMERVTGYARNIPNVRRVVSYVRVRPGEPVAAQAANSSPAPVVQPSPTAAPTAPTALTAPAADAPTQRSTIDVTPLR